MFEKSERNIENHGQNNINNTGDNNTINIYQSNSLQRSVLATYCQKLLDSINADEIEKDKQDYELSEVSDFEDKMNLNRLNTYRDIFEMVDHNYLAVEEVLNSFPEREKVIKHIRLIYLEQKIALSDPPDGDLVCLTLSAKLLELLEGRIPQEYYIESLKIAINSLMYYAFTKCKILQPVQ